MFYNEGAGAWSIIRLKKEILHEYPQLKEKRGDFGYELAVYTTYKEIMAVLKGMEKESKPIPLLLRFYRKGSGE